MKSSERSFARRIDLTSLQLFVAVCELGSICRAAEREFPSLFNLSEPTRRYTISSAVFSLKINTPK